MSNPRTVVRASAITRLLIALMQQPQTYADLVQISGLSQQTLRAWIRSLREARLVHIADWKADPRGCLVVPAFAWGFYADDVPRPAGKPVNVRVAEWRARKALA